MNYKIAICIPTRGVCLSRFIHSLIILLTRAHHISLPQPGSLQFSVFMREGTTIHSNRETLVQEALEWGATHLLFLDDDMTFDIRAVEILLGRQQSIVGVNYPRKMLPIKFTAVTADGKKDLFTGVESTGLEEVHHCGFGMVLIDSRIFETFPKPRFHPFWVEEANEYGSEDTAFCVAARRHGFKTFVDHDASKLVEHVGPHNYAWNQAVPDYLLQERLNE